MKTKLQSFTHLPITTAVMCALTAISARADTFGSGGNAFTLDFVTIGNPGNPVDTGTTGSYFDPYGAVGYTFRMGTYEISEDMINKANTLGGLLTTKDTRGVNKAATGVCWNEAARFVNWLNVSSGYSPAYKFAVQPGAPTYTNLVAIANLDLWTPSDAGYDASNRYRNANAHYFLPSEDEWYKAAYYSGSGNVYYDYATGSDTIPTAVAGGTGMGTAVYAGAGSVPADITQAGGLSHYGTMGQDGNVWDWIENASEAPNDSSYESRVFRGGSWFNDEINMRPSVRGGSSPDNSVNNIGFRVASVVPEPASAVLLLGGGALLALRRRRKYTDDQTRQSQP